MSHRMKCTRQAGRRIRLPVGQITALLLAAISSACSHTVPPADPNVVPPEEAKKHKIIYRDTGFTPPPRTIADITAILDRFPAAPRANDAELALLNEAPPDTDNNRELAAFYWKRGQADGRLGLVQRQLEDLRKAARYSKGLAMEDAEEGRILADLAVAEYQGGNFLTSLRLRQQSVQAAEDHRVSIRLQIAQLANLAEMYTYLGDREAARETLGKAETLLGNASIAPGSSRRRQNYDRQYAMWRAFINGAHATLLEDEGKYAEAEALRRQVLTEREEEVEQQKERRPAEINRSRQIVMRFRTRAETELALNLVKQERLVEAEAIIRKQLIRALRSHGRYWPGTGHSIVTFSQILYDEGRYDEARKLAESGIDICAKTGVMPESIFIVEARRARASALSAEGRWRDAADEMERMQAGLAGEPSLLRTLGRGDLEWALALVKTGKPQQALAMLNEMYDRTRERLGSDHYDVAEIRGFQAMAFAAAGRQEDALREYVEALPLLSAGADSTDGTRRSPARTRRLNLILESYLDLLANVRNGDLPRKAGIDPVAESFRVADLARGQSVQRALSSSAARAAATDPDLRNLVRREQDTSHEINALYTQLANLLAAPPSEQSREMIGKLRVQALELSKERRRSFAEIEKSFPAYVNLLNPRPPTLKQVRDALRPNEVLVSIYVGADRTYVWAVPKDGEAAFNVAALGDKQVSDVVTDLRKALDPGVASLGAMPAFNVAAAYQLYAQLLKPVERTWNDGDSLLVVTHRALGKLPFVLLPTAPVTPATDQHLLFANYRDVPWLVRRVAVTQLPSANALVTLRALPPGDPGRRAFVGFGDPLFNREQVAEAKAEGKRVMLAAATVTRGLPLRNLKVERVSAANAEMPDAPPVANSSQLAQVPRLPDTAEEIHEIASVLRSDDDDDVYLETRATEHRVETMNLANRRIVVFATHGLVPGDLDGLNQPALALTAPELTGDGGDGLLTMEEVLGLKLNADWVVLSACNTAAGDSEGGEAVSGLGRAFFYAGTRALLVTYWPVETASARTLTTELFRRQTADPKLTRAEALRVTMLAMIDKLGSVDPASKKMVFSYAHPLFWAPYALVGDGGS